MSQVGSVLRWPVSVIAVAYPRARNSDWSTGLAGEPRAPASPPTPLKINFPFQFAGSMASKPAEFGPAPSPEVAMEPFTSQYCGFGAAAATSVADVVVMFGTPSAASAATLQSIAEAGAAATAPQSIAANPANRIKTPGRPLRSMCACICDSSCRGLFRCQRVISIGWQSHQGRKARFRRAFLDSFREQDYNRSFVMARKE